jgi:thioredoxin-like negative regulator of GroEL
MPSRSAHCRLLLPAVACLMAVGCEIRDEPVRTTQQARLRWPDPVTRRLESDTDPAANTPSSTIAFVESCAAGRRLAEAAGKPLLIIFRAGWCRWSAAFTQQTLVDPTIVALSERFVCVQVDADRDAEVCRQYGVTHFPTVLVLNPDDREVTRRSGHTVVADLQPLLRRALAADRLVGTPAAPSTDAATVGDPAAPANEIERPIQTADAPTGEVSR